MLRQCSINCFEERNFKDVKDGVLAWHIFMLTYVAVDIRFSAAYLLCYLTPSQLHAKSLQHKHVVLRKHCCEWHCSWVGLFLQ